jgi:hypothetical protein
MHYPAVSQPPPPSKGNSICTKLGQTGTYQSHTVHLSILKLQF